MSNDLSFLEAYPQQQAVYYLSPLKEDFEQNYIAIRQREGRVYDDELVTLLPHLPVGHPHHLEWQLRQGSTQRLLRYLRQSNAQRILDLGCGNGWLSHQMAYKDEVEILGLDINRLELEQASRLFGHARCRFVYGDIFEDQWPAQTFDQIVLNSCAQYFPSIAQLLDRLLLLLRKDGCIHVLDSPIYSKDKVAAAQERSQAYFSSQGQKDMVQYYHHHSWDDLRPYAIRVAYTPNSWRARLRRWFLKNDSPFPWIIIPASV